MSKRVQILGHIAEIANQFLGLDREITVDEDNRELRLHDGATEGGRRFLDRDANDNRYQARSVELDGLLGWEPNERGFTVRLGPSNYRLRTLTVNGDQLTVVNSNGYDGNPYISFAAEIASNHTFTGEIVFSGPVAATAGIAGDLTGDSAGTHTGPVIGNTTGEHTGGAHGDHTGTFTGDVDVSAHGIAMADEQIMLPWLETAILEYIMSKGVMVGAIIAYSGAVGDLPDQWVVCDGTNGTPDLRDRFIVGAGPAYPVDTTGGQTSHTHAVTIDAGGAHTHTGTVGGTALSVAQLPAHKHANGVTDSAGNEVFSRGSTGAASTTPYSIERDGSDGTFEGWSETVGSDAEHDHSLAIDSGGDHTHTGSSTGSTNLPPYYSLVYVMKVV